MNKILIWTSFIIVPLVFCGVITLLVIMLNRAEDKIYSSFKQGFETGTALMGYKMDKMGMYDFCLTYIDDKGLPAYNIEE
jgi:hypothetical protein